MGSLFCLFWKGAALCALLFQTNAKRGLHGKGPAVRRLPGGGILGAQGAAHLLDERPLAEGKIPAAHSLVGFAALARKQHHVAGLGHAHRGLNGLVPVRNLSLIHI